MRAEELEAGLLRWLIPDELREEVKAALEGDSNDAEHDALVAVADTLGIRYEIDPDLYNSDWVEIETVDAQSGEGVFNQATPDRVEYVNEAGEAKYIEWPFIRSLRFPNRGG